MSRVLFTLSCRASGLTYDGHGVNATTGGLAEPVHLFSAASKESIHISILALAVSGNEEFVPPYSLQPSLVR